MGQIAVFVFLFLAEVLVPGLQTARADVLESYVTAGKMEITRDADGIVGTVDSQVIFRTEQSRTHAALHLVQFNAGTPVLVDLSELLVRYRGLELVDTAHIEFEAGEQLPFPDLQGPLLVSAVGELLYVALPEHELLFIVETD